MSGPLAAALKTPRVRREVNGKVSRFLVCFRGRAVRDLGFESRGVREEHHRLKADQSPQPAIPEKFEQACAEVLSDLPAEENRIVPAEEPGEPNPQFEKMARIYLSKSFAMLAYFLEDDEIKLDDDQMSILVPDGVEIDHEHETITITPVT